MPERHEAYLKKISLLLKKDALRILLKLREKECRFKELPGNSFTKSNRLRELRAEKLIEQVILTENAKERSVVGYKLTQKGSKILENFDLLFKILSNT